MNTPKHPTFGEAHMQVTEIGSAEAVILPLCYENAPSYGSGSREGGLHILEASSQLEFFDEEELLDWSGIRVHTLPPLILDGDPGPAVMEMKAAAHRVLSQKKFLLSLGGDHAVTLGPVMAAADCVPGIGVLQIDAHLDLRNEWNGSPYNHACVMRRIVEDVGCPVVQVGIRSFSPEEAAYIRAREMHPFFAHTIDPLDESWMDRVVAQLPDKVYLTVDLDGLDPSVVPGTGTPEPGGLTYRQVIRLIKKVAGARDIVAADINELTKIEGSQVSEYTAARIAAKILIHKCCQ